MTMTDPIADMLTRIRNAQGAKLLEVTMPASKLKIEIARLLKDEGYISDYRLDKTKANATLLVILKYHNGKPVISKLKRISRPGLRIYRKSGELPKILGGMGLAIISTPRGLLTDHAARAEGLGGEVIFTIE